MAFLENNTKPKEMGFKTYITGIFKGIKSLLTGMRVTNYYFFHPKEIVTERYPENRDTLKMFERFKGEVIMLHNENNEHSCTGCGICELNCPNGSIEIITRMEADETGKMKKVIDKHIYHLGMCTFCGLCVQKCPSDALSFGNDFEQAVFDRSKLNKVLNNEGSKLMKEVK